MKNEAIGTLENVLSESNEHSQLQETQLTKEEFIMINEEIGMAENVVSESSEVSQLNKVQSAKNDSMNQNAQDFPEDQFSEFRSFTISKSISCQEAGKIMNDFDKYYRRNKVGSSKRIMGKRVNRYYDSNADKDVKVIMDGIAFDFYEVICIIKSYRTIIDNHENMDNVLEIEINPKFFDDSENLTFDGNSLRPIEEGYIEKIWRKSPLLEDISVCKLKKIEYNCRLYFEETCPHELIEDLVRQSNIFLNYIEWEYFGSGMVRRDVKTTWNSVSENPNMILLNVQRTFPKPHTWSDLVGHDSISTKLVIEQMLSDDYRRRCINKYLKAVFMGGSYYSMDKAVSIIESSSLDDDRKNQLISTLKLVRRHEGIAKTKIVFKDNREDLFDFINALHELVELGINPVTIPKKYKIEKLSNPVHRYFNHPENIVGDEKKASSRVEIYEKIGDIDTQCRL